MEQILKYWPVIIFISVQIIGSIVAFALLRQKVKRMDKDLQKQEKLFVSEIDKIEQKRDESYSKFYEKLNEISATVNQISGILKGSNIVK